MTATKLAAVSAQIWLVTSDIHGTEPVAAFSSEQRAQVFADARNRQTMGSSFGDPNAPPDYVVLPVDFEPEP